MPREAGKPRGRVSAYAFFVQSSREEMKRKQPSETVGFSDFSKMCSERWKVMSEKDKHRFQVMADSDKKRYDTEMANYVPQAVDGRKIKKFKDPNAPKRPLTGFFWFCNDERPKVKATMPDSGVGSAAKELGRRWHECTEEQKAKYHALAAKDKARYEKELAQYKAAGGGVVAGGHAPSNSNAKAAAQAILAAQAKMQSSEEEEEDDEEDEYSDEED